MRIYLKSDVDCIVRCDDGFLPSCFDWYAYVCSRFAAWMKQLARENTTQIHFNRKRELHLILNTGNWFSFFYFVKQLNIIRTLSLNKKTIKNETNERKKRCWLWNLERLEKKRIQQVFFYNFYDDDDVKRLFFSHKKNFIRSHLNWLAFLCFIGGFFGKFRFEFCYWNLWGKKRWIENCIKWKFVTNWILYVQ